MPWNEAIHPIIPDFCGDARHIADVLRVLAHLFFRWGSIVLPFPQYPVDSGILQDR